MDLFAGLEAFQAKDYATALTHIRPLAEQGHAHARYLLAACFRQGWGLNTDSAEAAKWMRLGAEGGFYAAQREYAELLKAGVDTTQNLEEAARWFERAANQGDSTAMLALSDMFYHGKGLPPDPKTSTAWLKRAAEWGHVFAQKELAGRYMRGDGVRKNPSAAMLWFTIAEAVPAGFVKACGLTADEAAKITQRASRWRKQRQVPRGKFLLVEVCFSIKLWKDKELQEGHRETFRAPCTFFEDPLLGFQFSVMNVRIARDLLWRGWSTRKESLEADPKIEQVFFIKREYWTDQNPDRRFVTDFVKAFGDFPHIPTEF